VHGSQFLDPLFLSPDIEMIEAALPRSILGNFTFWFYLPTSRKQRETWGTQH
jgi:hypothetical protein